MQELGAVERLDIHFPGVEQHVGAGVTVEHEFPFAVRSQRDERQRGARFGREDQRADVHAAFSQDVSQEVTKGVVADLAHEGAGNSKPRQANGHVAGCAARRFDEGRRIGQAGAGDGRDKINQQFAQTDGIGHVESPHKDS